MLMGKCVAHGWCGRTIFCLQIAADGLKGRVFEVSLADLQNVSLCCLVQAAGLCQQMSSHVVML